MRTYTVAEIRKRTGWPKGQRFVREEDHTALDVALCLALTTPADARECVNECGCTAHLTTDERRRGYMAPCPHHAGYTLLLYGATRADGGYLVSRFSYPGQRDSIHAARFDVADGTWYLGQVTFRAAIERIRVVRTRLINEYWDARGTSAASSKDGHP